MGIAGIPQPQGMGKLGQASPYTTFPGPTNLPQQGQAPVFPGMGYPAANLPQQGMNQTQPVQGMQTLQSMMQGKNR